MSVVAAAPPVTFGELLAERGEPLAACRVAPWLADFLDVPDDAAPPLAMSGPHPRAVGSYGPECIEWARAEFGITMRWWQALAITRQLEHDAAGELVWREIIETGPRRIGKSVRLRIVALWRIAHADLIGETQLSMLVSKDLAVGKEIHRGSWRWAEAPHRKEQGWKVVRLNGGQEVEAPDESRWLLRADSAVYGYDVGYGQVDESWGVDPQSITDGLEPALLERLWSQLHLTSTAHVKATSLMRRRLTAALRDADPDVLLLMWGARPDADFADEETWRAASPHWSTARHELMRRKYAAALAGEQDPEIDDPDPVRGWAAQYLNVWPLLLDSADSIFPDWSSLADVGAEAPESASVVIDVAPDRKGASVGVAGAFGEKTLVMCQHYSGTNTTSIVEQVKDLVASGSVSGKVALTPGQAELLAPALTEAGIEFDQLTSGQMAASCAGFQVSVRDGQVAHIGQPELDLAVINARTRYSQEREKWDRREPGIDISPLVACSAAAYRWGLGQHVTEVPAIF